MWMTDRQMACPGTLNVLLLFTELSSRSVDFLFFLGFCIYINFSVLLCCTTDIFLNTVGSKGPAERLWICNVICNTLHNGNFSLAFVMIEAYSSLPPSFNKSPFLTRGPLLWIHLKWKVYEWFCLTSQLDGRGQRDGISIRSRGIL